MNDRQPFAVTQEMTDALDREIAEVSQIRDPRRRPDKIRLPRGSDDLLPRPDLSRGDGQDQENPPRDPAPPIPEDPINPPHYRKHPSGIECIEVTEHMMFNPGNAVKYIWRYLDKGDPVENLRKAQWYLEREILRLTRVR
jgi:hypothetical protein